MRLSDFSVLTFDCYGTLIDWETGIFEALAPWLERAGLRPERDQLLEAFAQLEAAQQAATPALRYPELLAEVHRGLAERFGIAPDAQAAAAFGASVGDWPAFPDSAEALAYLKQHYRLVILSNVDRASFARSNRKLGVSLAFDLPVLLAAGYVLGPAPAGLAALLGTVDLDEIRGRGSLWLSLYNRAQTALAAMAAAHRAE